MSGNGHGAHPFPLMQERTDMQLAKQHMIRRPDPRFVIIDEYIYLKSRLHTRRVYDAIF